MENTKPTPSRPELAAIILAGILADPQKTKQADRLSAQQDDDAFLTKLNTQLAYAYADALLAADTEQPQPTHPNVTVAIEWLEKAMKEMTGDHRADDYVAEALENLHLIQQPQPVAQTPAGWARVDGQLWPVSGHDPEAEQPVAETPNRAMYEALKGIVDSIEAGNTNILTEAVPDTLGPQLYCNAKAALAAFEQHAPQQPAGDGGKWPIDRLKAIDFMLFKGYSIQPNDTWHKELQDVIQLLTPSKP